jgi:predicted transcriptional regulator
MIKSKKNINFEKAKTYNIIEYLLKENFNQTDISRLFHISQPTVSNIKKDIAKKNELIDIINKSFELNKIPATITSTEYLKIDNVETILRLKVLCNDLEKYANMSDDFNIIIDACNLDKYKLIVSFYKYSEY